MSQMDCSQFESLYEAALLVIANAQKLRDWTNGDEQTDIELGGKLVPTIRKLVATIDARESTAAKEAIANGVARAEDAAQRAEESAQGVKSIIGTGKCPIVTRQVQELSQASGTYITVPSYYPFAGGIHVYYDGALLSSGIHYHEQMPDDGDEQSTVIKVLFDIEAGGEWEFHTWQDTVEPEQPEQSEEGA